MGYPCCQRRCLFYYAFGFKSLIQWLLFRELSVDQTNRKKRGTKKKLSWNLMKSNKHPKDYFLFVFDRTILFKIGVQHVIKSIFFFCSFQFDVII